MMAILLPCECGKQLRVKEDMAGKKIRCPNCQAVLAVPAEGAGELEPAEAPPASVRPAPAVRTPPRAEPPRDRPAPPRQLALRIVVLVLGILGGLAAGLMAAGLYTVANDPTEKMAAEIARRMIQDLEKASPSSPQLAELRAGLARFERNALVGHIGLAAAVLGIAAALLAFFRMGKVAAPLMILPAAAAGILNAKTLVFTALLIVTGILCLFIKSKPRAAVP